MQDMVEATDLCLVPTALGVFTQITICINMRISTLNCSYNYLHYVFSLLQANRKMFKNIQNTLLVAILSKQN